jgi:16S rRNA (guanine1207-N2)-methyltransferase
MEALSQLLARNIPRLEAGAGLDWINPAGDSAWQALAAVSGACRLFCQDIGTAEQLRAAGADATFGDFPELGPDGAGHVILSLPRSKAALDMMLHCIAAQLPQLSRLWLAGENRAGIKSAAGPLARRYARVRKLDSARHCVLFEASEPLPMGAFDAEEWRSEFHVLYGTGTLALASWPGVFSHGRLDEGTALLLHRLLEARPARRALDFGAGCGVLGACLARDHTETHVVLADSHALALRSARATLGLNGLQAEVVASDGFKQLEGRFDLVVSNPPFHRGHKTMAELSMQLLAPVRNFLNPGGQLLLVVNRHLPYRRWLDELFGSHAVLESNTRYHVLRARLPG